MTRPLVRIYIGEGEFLDREMNDAEFAQWELDQQKIQAEKAELIEKANAKVALLERLGITEDEARLLLA